MSRFVVGYRSETDVAAGDWLLLGVNFETVGDSGEMPIQDFIKGCTPAVTDGDPETTDAPVIQVWDGVGYLEYYYIDEDYDGEQNCWVSGGFKTEDTLVPGQAVWFRSNTDCATLTIAGQVAAAGKTVDLVANDWNLVSNPYPVSFELNNGDIDWGTLTPAVTDGDPETTDAPVIQVWDGVGYLEYYFVDEDYDGETNCWVSGGFKYDDPIPCGAGFWVRFAGAEDVTISFK